MFIKVTLGNNYKYETIVLLPILVTVTILSNPVNLINLCNLLRATLSWVWSTGFKPKWQQQQLHDKINSAAPDILSSLVN